MVLDARPRIESLDCIVTFLRRSIAVQGIFLALVTQVNQSSLSTVLT